MKLSHALLVACALATPASAAGTKKVMFCGFGGVLTCGSMATVARMTGSELRDWTQADAVIAEVLRQRPTTLKLGGASLGARAANLVADAAIAAGIPVESVALLTPFGTGAPNPSVRRKWANYEIDPITHVVLNTLPVTSQAMAAFVNGR